MQKPFKKFVSELLFPSFCLGCQREGTYICEDCKSLLEILEYRYCLCSKNPLRLENKTLGIAEGKCQRCQHKKLSGLYFALYYKEKFLVKKIIYQFKYPPYLKNLAKPLAEIIEEHLTRSGINNKQIQENSILMPVPIEIKKMKMRGYNQAEQLAKELSKILTIPVALSNLIKVKKTLSQTQLSAKERQENVKDAFFVKNINEVKGKKVFLVDDVYTTGSTMEECARVLKEAGVKLVWGIAIAREE